MVYEKKVNRVRYFLEGKIIMHRRKTAIILITMLLLHICLIKEDSFVCAISVKEAKFNYKTLYYEMCEEYPEYDWSYSYLKVPNEAVPYFAMKAESVENPGWGYVYLKHVSRGKTIRIPADDVQYGKKYVLGCQYLLKYKGMCRMKVWLYKVSRGKIVKHSQKTIKGKTPKKMVKNLNKWLTKKIHEKNGVRFKMAKWRY